MPRSCPTSSGVAGQLSCMVAMWLIVILRSEGLCLNLIRKRMLSKTGGGERPGNEAGCVE